MANIQELKQAIKQKDILEVLEKLQAVELTDFERQTRKIVCPFHDDKDPSLVFYDDHYYCYGCASQGDAFDFLEALYGINFSEAAQKCAEVYGIELTEAKISPSKPTLQSKLDNEWQYFQTCLRDAPSTVQELSKDFFPLEVGYDPKINYFVFRYTSKLNQTLGFTKRRIGESDGPKWVHSKKENSKTDLCAQCYGLGKAAKAIKKTGHTIFVEGVKDTIPYIMHNKKEVIALSGTHHFQAAYGLIQPKTITLALDGDTAGLKGMKDIVLFLADKHDLSKVVVHLYFGKDPYDTYKETGLISDDFDVFNIFTKDELQPLYVRANDFNKELILSYFVKTFDVSYKGALAFFSMQDVQKPLKKEVNEVEQLKKQGSKDDLEKLRLKYGIV